MKMVVQVGDAMLKEIGYVRIAAIRERAGRGGGARLEEAVFVIGA